MIGLQQLTQHCDVLSLFLLSKKSGDCYQIGRLLCLVTAVRFCTTWCVLLNENGGLEDKLNSFTTSCYRIILGIKRMDFISNEDVLKRVKQDLLIQLTQQRQFHFLGHILRKPENELVNRYTLFHPKHGKRKPGHPKLMFHQYIASVINQAYPPPPEEIQSMVKGRKAWRKLVTDCSAVGWWWWWTVGYNRRQQSSDLITASPFFDVLDLVN